MSTTLLKEQKHSITSIFILLLLLIFSMLAISLITFGSNVYQETTAGQNVSFSNRTSFAYLTEKIRQAEDGDFVHVIEKNDTSVLCLDSYINEMLYVTYLYEYDGYLMEYFTNCDLDFDLRNGNKISEIHNLSFQLKNPLLHITFSDSSDTEHTIYMYLHTLEATNGYFTSY